MDFGIDKKLWDEALTLYVEELGAELPTKEESADMTFPPDFLDRLRKRLDNQQKFYYYWFNTIGKRVAAVALIVVIGLLTVTFSVKALREPFLKFIVEVFEKFTSIVMVQEEPEASSIFIPVEPSYVPSGFTLVPQFDGEVNNWKQYESDDGRFISYSQQFNTGFVVTIDTENVDYEEVTINSIKGIVYTNKGNTTIVFKDERYVYIITGTASKEEMLHMAESIPISIKYNF